mgnify:FL=1
MYSVKSLEIICTSEGEISCNIQSGESKKSKAVDDTATKLHFVKHSICPPLSPDNISKYVDVHASHGSPLDSLYTALQGMWCPMLLENSDQRNKLTPRIQQLLTELESSLKT